MVWERPAWHADAACRGRGTDGWFPEDDTARSVIRLARALCETCPTRVPCAAQGEQEKQGTWAGELRTYFGRSSKRAG